MVFFIIGLILLVIAVIGLLVGLFGGKSSKDARVGGIGLFVIAGAIGGIAVLSQTFYSQDTGEASVLVDISGNIAGQETTPGFHGKAPWQDVKTFNVRNQTVSFVGAKGDTDYSGGSAQGPQVTTQDADGVTSNIDVNLVYSIDPTKVTDIYKGYRDEQTFVQQFVVQQVRAITRDVPNEFSTLDLITKRTEVGAALQQALETKWDGTGVHVTQVNLQDIRPPQSVTESYAAAQQAQINVTKAKAELSATEVSAQQQVVQAKAQAQANAELNKGLTDAVLKSRYIDALKEIGAKGNLVVVPEGTNPIINTGK